MASNYTGVATATQAPSGAPTPGGAPIASIPADADPRNAASVTQMVKVAMDWIAWAFSPRARSAAWAEAVIRFRSALLHTRFGIDHLGLPGGRIQQWNEMWERGIGFAGTVGPQPITGSVPGYDVNFENQIAIAGAQLQFAGIAANFAAAQPFLTGAGNALAAAPASYNPLQELGSHWRARTLQAGAGTSAISFVAPSSTFNQRHSVVVLAAGDTANDYANLWRGANVGWDDNLTFALEWEATLQAANTVKHTIGLGLSQENLPFVGASPALHFAGFTLAPGGGNWFVSNRGGGATGSVDTGVAATTAATRFRVEFHGATASDDLGRTLRYYINGTQVGGDVVTNIPLATFAAAASFCCVNTLGGSAGLASPLQLGPVRFVSNIYGSDVF